MALSMTTQFNEDLNILKAKLASLKTVWEGKPSVLELKQANYNWKQMEWWAFYFEYYLVTFSIQAVTSTALRLTSGAM